MIWLGCATSRNVDPSPQIDRVTAHPDTKFRVGADRKTEIDVFDYHQQLVDRSARMQSCELPGGRSVQLVSREDGQDWALAIRDGTTTREVLPKPRSQVRGADWRAFPNVGCDAEVDRFFFGHPLLGYVAAFSREGDQLWIETVPHFVGMDTERADTPSLDSLRDRPHDVLGGVYPSGPYVLVEYTDSSAGLRRHAVFHRSGKLIGVLGPWDAAVKDGTGGRWTFYGPIKVPNREFDVEVVDDDVPVLIDHVLAWLTPPEGASRYGFRMCTYLPPTTIQKLLGDRYSEQQALRARDIVVALGAEWLVGLSESEQTGLAVIEHRFVPDSVPWRKDYYRALLDSGADVKAMAMESRPQQERG